MTETVITDGLVAIGDVRECDDGLWQGFSIDDRLVCTDQTRQAATSALLKAVRLAHARAQ